MLKLDGVRAGYGRVNVLHGVSLEIHSGEAIAVVGANGAGKTTMLRTISGLLPVSGGQITFQDRVIGRMQPSAIARLGIAHVPEGRQVFPDFTVVENLRAGAIARHDQQGVMHEIEQILAQVPELERRRGIPARQLSGGEQQLLALYRALMSSPKLLLLDEPSMGLAPILVKKIYEHVTRLKNAGMTIMLVEQNLGAALKLVDRIYVLSEGGFSFEGTPAELESEQDVLRLYLGVGGASRGERKL